jgi:hypothetical protein
MARGGVLGILDALLGAEKLQATLYARGLDSGLLPGDLSSGQLPAFQAALGEEFRHVQRLAALGARFPQNEFFFPAPAFSLLPRFLEVALQLEEAGIAAYLAASYQFARHRVHPRYALAVARILAVEAEHRALVRSVAGLHPPNDLRPVRLLTFSVARASEALAPHLGPGRFGGASTAGMAFPDLDTVARLAGAFAGDDQGDEASSRG